MCDHQQYYSSTSAPAVREELFNVPLINPTTGTIDQYSIIFVSCCSDLDPFALLVRVCFGDK
jgi:hypothetical protein